MRNSLKLIAALTMMMSSALFPEDIFAQFPSFWNSQPPLLVIVCLKPISIISDNSRKAIIIDTLLEAVLPLTREELSGVTAALFHVLVSTDRLTQLIDTLYQKGIILFDTEGHIEITPVHKSDFITNQFQETARGTGGCFSLFLLRQYVPPQAGIGQQNIDGIDQEENPQ